MSAPAGGDPAALRALLDARGERLAPATALLGALRALREALPTLAIVLVGGSAGGRRATVTLAVGGAVIVGSLARAVLRWWTTRWTLTDDGLAMRTGIVWRAHRVVPYARLQALDLQQTALHRLLGLTLVRADTPGGGDAEVTLDALTTADAVALRETLLARRDAAPAASGAAIEAPDPPPPPPARAVGAATEPAPAEPLLARGVRDLLIAGATRRPAAALLALLALGLQGVDEVAGTERIGAWLAPLFVQGVGMSAARLALAATATVVAAMLLGVTVGALVTAVRFHGYVLARRGRALEARWGGVARHVATVSLDRVQAVRLEAALLRRPFGLSALWVDVAGRIEGGAAQEAVGARAPLVPMVRPAEARTVVGAVLPGCDVDAFAWRRAHPAARRRLALLLSLPVVLAAGGAAALLDVAWLGALAIVPLAWALAHLAWRLRGWGLADGWMATRRGVFTRTTTIAARQHVVTVGATASPFQRRHGLVTLTLTTAAPAGTLVAADIPHADARALAAAVGFRGPLLPAGADEPTGAGPTLVGPAPVVAR